MSTKTSLAYVDNEELQALKEPAPINGAELPCRLHIFLDVLDDMSTGPVYIDADFVVGPGVDWRNVLMAIPRPVFIEAAKALGLKP